MSIARPHVSPGFSAGPRTDRSGTSLADSMAMLRDVTMTGPGEPTGNRRIHWPGLCLIAGLLLAILTIASPLATLLPAPLRGALSAASEYRWYVLSGRDFLLMAAAFCIPVLLFARRSRQFNVARRTLKEREDQLTAYSEAALDWFWETDEHHRIKLVFGGAVAKKKIDPSSYVGKTRQELAGADQVAGIAEQWQAHQAVIERHEPFRNFEYKMMSVDGKLLTVSVSGVPIFDDNCAFRGYRGTGTDVTALRRATEGSRTNEALLWSVLNNAPLIVLIKDNEGRYIRVNKMACEAFGAEEADILGKTSSEIFPATLAKTFQANDRQVMQSREPHRHEFRLETPNGTREFLSVKFPVVDRDDTAVGLGAIMMDISERKEQEREVRDSEARLRDFASSASDWFWETDADLKLTHISGRFEKNGEETGRQAIGKSRFEVASAAELARNPERWQDHKEILERREPFRSFEFEIETESGEHRLISSSGVPMFDETGTFRGYRGGATDVTEQRQAEHNAAAALEQLEFLANTVPALITSIDREGRFQLVNRQAEAWYARPRDQIVGRKIEDIFGPHEIDIFRPFYREVAEGREVSKELEIAYPDGVTRHVAIRWVPRMRDGEYDGFVALVVDVSDQHSLQETLRQSQKMEALGQLTGGVAHDFNNLLLAIQGNLELLREDMAEGDDGVRLVTNSLRGVERAAELTRRLLAFSRRQPFTQESVQIDRMVRDMKEMLSRLLEENIAIEVAFGDLELTARTDRAQLENAVLNLAINARDAMPDGGTLTVRADVVQLDADAVAGHDSALPGRFIRLSVADTGRGMTAETCRRALEPFFTTKEIGAGTGLGLSMVHGFVQQSGGFIEIDSKPDRGTAIHLYLPAAEPGEKADEIDAKRAVTVPRANNDDSRILLVEDEPLVREVASLTLKALGYSVTEAANGVEALDVLRSEAPFDLLLTDIVMPGGVSGIDLVDRAFRLQPGIRAIMATGHIGSGEQAAAERMPDVPVLRKPFSRETLGRSISSVLASPKTGSDTARAASA